MEVGPGKFTLTNEVNIDKSLGIEIIHLDEKILKTPQSFLIDRIISFLTIDTNDSGLGTKSKSTPAGKTLLHKTYLASLAKKIGTTKQQ